MESTVYDTIAADILAGGLLFKANGSKKKFDGYLRVYTEGRDDDSKRKKYPFLIWADEVLSLKSWRRSSISHSHLSDILRHRL